MGQGVLDGVGAPPAGGAVVGGAAGSTTVASAGLHLPYVESIRTCALAAWSLNQRCSASCRRCRSPGSTCSRRWSSIGGRRRPITWITWQPNWLLTGCDTGEAQAPLVLPLQVPCPASANTAFSNSGTVSPLLVKPRSPPLSLLPGSCEYCLATSFHDPPSASRARALSAVALSCTSTWRTCTWGKLARRLASSASLTLGGTSLAVTFWAAIWGRTCSRSRSRVRPRCCSAWSKLPFCEVTCARSWFTWASTSASLTVMPSCLAPWRTISDCTSSPSACRLSAAPVGGGVPCWEAVAWSAFAVALSRSTEMLTPSTTAAWPRGTSEGAGDDDFPQPAQSRQSRTTVTLTAGRRRRTEGTPGKRFQGRAASLVVRHGSCRRHQAIRSARRGGRAVTGARRGRRRGDPRPAAGSRPAGRDLRHAPPVRLRKGRRAARPHPTAIDRL